MRRVTVINSNTGEKTMHLTRRNFLASSAAAGAMAGLGSFRAHAAEPLVCGTPNADKLGWRVGFSAYSFRRVTLFEALDRMEATGLHHTELFTWQKLSPKHGNAQAGPGLSNALQGDLKKKASDCGVRLIGCYANAGRNAEGWKAVFAFAADMGFEVVVGEPSEAMLDVIEPLTEEYKVDLALHNHPQPSHYWNPDVGVAALKGRSKRMGFCCDTGHWCRSNLEPVAMLRKVGPRVKTFHLKDLDAFGVGGARDVIWGQGKGRIAEILTEVKKQGIPHPYFGIEWERTDRNELSDHAASATFFEQVASRLAAS
jgi:sugar phosphate isomerase/epimerase